MGRELKLIPCAGLAAFAEFSIFGDQNKPSLVAWAIKKNKLSKSYYFVGWVGKSKWWIHASRVN